MAYDRPTFVGGTRDSVHDGTAMSTVRPNFSVERATTLFIVMRSATNCGRGRKSGSAAPCVSWLTPSRRRANVASTSGSVAVVLWPL